MEFETEETRKTHITEEMACGATLKMTVDHVDDDMSFGMTIGSGSTRWYSASDFATLKKVINKALKLKREG
jgi:hypothetical protein